MYHKIKFLLIICMFTLLIADEVVHVTHPIQFTGQEHFTTTELEDALGVDNKSFFEFWKKDDPRIKAKLLPLFEETITSFYNSEGFYDINVHINETNTTVNVTINENEPVRIEENYHRE